MKKLVAVLFLLLFASGCAHYVDFKPPESYKHEKTLNLKMAFYMPSDLKSKMYFGRAMSSGIANRWDVPVGSVVREYGIAYLKNGVSEFSELQALDANASYDMLVTITDIQYHMAGQAAHCDLTIKVADKSGNSKAKKYHADGPSGYGRVLAGGAFAQKSAIRQSTHVVLENIFKEFMADLRTDN